MKFIQHSSPNSWGHSIEIMEKKGRAFGRIYWFNDEEENVYLDMLDVDQDMRDKGIGTKLQEMREEIGRKQGAIYSYLWVFENSWMHKWYQRRGYEDWKPHDEQSDAVWMRKSLK